MIKKDCFTTATLATLGITSVLALIFSIPAGICGPTGLPTSGPPSTQPVFTTPATQVTAPATAPLSPVMPVFTRPDNNSTNPVLPIDVSHTTDYMNSLGPKPGGEYDAISGVSETRGFPSPHDLHGPTDFLTVLPGSDAVVHRESPYMVQLKDGTALASVRRPSLTGMVHTEVADISFTANSDAIISTAGGLTRIKNVDGMGQTLKVRINIGPGRGSALTLAPGFELVVADHKLSRADVRPNDGVMRRGTHILDGGQTAVSEYYVEGALTQSAFVKELVATHEGDSKAKRVISDMTRMAAVLNQMNGMQGYTTEQ